VPVTPLLLSSPARVLRHKKGLKTEVLKPLMSELSEKLN
jgi:hypothetical protein